MKFALFYFDDLSRELSDHFVFAMSLKALYKNFLLLSIVLGEICLKYFTKNNRVPKYHISQSEGVVFMNSTTDEVWGFELLQKVIH